MFVSIEEYIQKPKEERQSHLNLLEPCIEIGGHDSREYRGLLAHFLKTTIPIGMKIYCCHACHNHKCSNVLHLYWGTAGENNQDAYSCGANKPIKQRYSQSSTKGRVWVSNLKESKMIYPISLQNYLDQGYIIGRRYGPVTVVANGADF